VSDRFLVRASLVVSAVAIGAVAFLLVDGRGHVSNAPIAPPAAAEPSPAAPHPVQPARPAVRRPVEPRSTAPGARPLDQTAFWRLVDETRRAAGNDTARQSELLKERLTQLPPREIVEFARIRKRLDQGAYTWKLWGAAVVIEDGCSDDCFRDFRAYVISLGRGPYERALHDPDSLASVAKDAETGDWENADNVAPDAYASVTGEDFPLDDSDLSGRPAGTPLSLDGAALRGRYPRLAARFRR
jgi:hypothetical protein